MSRTDFHHDSSRSAAIPPPASAPPPPVPPPPPAAPPQAEESSAASRPIPVPPPPPTRSTLPPVRPAPSPAVPSGVGSAKGVRWRGELDEIDQAKSRSGRKAARNHVAARRTASAPSDADPTNQNEEADEETATRVSREAPPWLVSLIVHLVLLLILALISTPAGKNLGKVILSVGESERETPAELAEFSISTDEMPQESELITESEVNVDMSSIFDSATLSDVEPITPLEVGTGPELAAVRPMFEGRTGAMKQALLAIYGGTPETQEAVRRGLEWLKRNQRTNGSWSMRGPYGDGATSENVTAATAMALLAFLGDGHTHKSGDYMREVERGIRFLLSQQDRQGFFVKNARRHEKAYAQGQATIVVCELYGMTKDSWLREPAQLALDYAMEAQSAEGGWRYEPRMGSDTSVTGWFVMALESGRSAGLYVDPDVFTKVNDYLDTAASYEDAAYGYQANSSPSPAMTAEGLLCRQYTLWNRNHPPLKRGIDALLLDAPFQLSDRDVYYWYYATQVMHHFGGSPWRTWNESMRVELPKAQVRGGKEDGSWSPQMDRWGRNSGRLYTTCLSLYCLEVYYRHMPLYAADGKQNL